MPVWESGSGAQRIDSTVAFRRSDYSHSGTIDSWKIGSEFQVIEDLRLRVTKSRDVREPTFGEQFESGGGGANITDPVDKTSYTITLLTGGNANLRPEVADTITGGFVYAPTFASWIEGLSVSADYFEIAVAGRVSTLGSQRVIDDCFKGDKALCNLVTRNAASGKIERVLDVNLNVSAAMNKGVDIEARYDLEPDFFSSEAESMNFRMFAGKLLENSVTTTVYQDNLGSNASPEWTANVMMGYNLGNFGLNLSERYYDSTKVNVTWSEGVQVDDNTIASQSVTNMGISYRGETSNGGNWVTSFNINNLFDRNPPIFPSESQRGGQQPAGNNFDVFGRRFQLNLNYNF